MLSKIIYGKTHTAVEHGYLNSKEYFILLTIKQVKKEFVITKSKKFDSLENCTQNLIKKKPIHLIINNKTTIKKVLPEIFDTAIEAAKTAFPSIKINDFFVEVSNFNNSCLVTICRKNIINELLDLYQQQHINIVNFTLGSSSTALIYSLFKLDTIQTSNTIIHITNDTELSIDIPNGAPTRTYDLNGLKLESNYLLNFATILRFYINKASFSNFSHELKSLKADFLQQKIFSFGRKFSLGFMLISLLINFFFFTEFQQEISLLEQEVQYAYTYKDNLIFLTKEVRLKEELVTNLTENSNSKVSYYLDDLAKNIPNSILLNTIYYQPLEKRIKEDKKILFEPQKMVISGISSKGKEFNQWMHVLESKDWVKSSAVIDYGTGKQTKTSFTIYLYL